ncbi:choice-of-anchor B family protein [Thalassomonas actiniarum]|uniref:Choice-of-anchor B family protein n=1 Tax=Thalassomonas actiniarum TaxID=485447 RepID=A0AAE9YSD9_9GAMM|nr:choice-of-anchor B family protein [Thalassomonas actiniarum]WDD99852.1 choice-of-anchor B family protein [Thalassomonas actiniarum]
MIIKIVYLSLLTTFFSSASFAHSEHDKARFVANQGQDKGKCDLALRPCKTIAYAVSQANKGDKILVAGGTYPINSTEELFYLKSALVPVYGGYNRFDHYQSQSPDSNPTLLQGVPAEMAANLRQQGFSLVGDGKSHIDEKKLKKQLDNYASLSRAQSQQNCSNGQAGNFACKNIDLLAHMPLSQFSTSPGAASDIWGHVDLNTGNEYALMGLTNGIAVVDISDAANPVEVGTIAGANSNWRDIKVYQYYDHNLKVWRAYAYATVDNTLDYVTIINLNNLPHSVTLAEKNTAVATAHNIYISNTDPTLNIAKQGLTPSLQLLGANKFSGAFHNYSLENPASLTALNNASVGNGYTHDGSSVVISDNRAASDCQSNGNCTVFIDFNENEMKLWNISNPDNISQLGSAQYDDVPLEARYVHSGWASEDQQTIFLHDEFDERVGGLNTTLRMFSIADLNNPLQIGTWTGDTAAADHNGYVRGNRYYMSTYERGLTVLDISQAATPVEVAYFDTFPSSDNATYNGAWGVYPFLPSGNILLSDINSGLYILKDNSQTSPQGDISFSQSAISAVEGESIEISVQRNADAPTSDTSVSYQILPGSALPDEDYTQVSGTLTWTGNDNTVKTISVAVLADVDSEGDDEFGESFYLRLYNPTGGATISSPSYLTVNIAGKANTGVIGFTREEIILPENQGPASITVSREGNTEGEVSVSYQLENNSALIDEDVENTSGTLTWSDGDKSNKTITLALINDDLSEEEETFTLNLVSVNDSRLGNFNQLSVTISDDESNQAPSVNLGEDKQVNTRQSHTLTSTVSDPENDPLSYLWSQSSGPTVTMFDSTQNSMSFIAPDNASQLSFSLAVTDSKGATTTDSINVTVVGSTSDTGDSGGGGGAFHLSYLLMLLPLIWRRRRR